MKTLIDYGVDGIMTDRPKKLKDILQERLLWPHQRIFDLMVPYLV